MESVREKTEADRSLIVSTVLYYGRKIRASQEAKFHLKLSAGLCAPLITEGAILKYLYAKADSFLYTGEHVPSPFTLENGALAEDVAAFEAFKSKVLRSPLFWIIAALSLSAQWYLVAVTLGASRKITNLIHAAISSPPGKIFFAVGDGYNKVLGKAGTQANLVSTYALLRSAFHVNRHRTEIKKARKKLEPPETKAAPQLGVALNTAKEINAYSLRGLRIRVRGAAKFTSGTVLSAFGAAGFSLGPIEWAFGAGSIIAGRALIKEGYAEVTTGREYQKSPRRKKKPIAEPISVV